MPLVRFTKLIYKSCKISLFYHWLILNFNVFKTKWCHIFLHILLIYLLHTRKELTAIGTIQLLYSWGEKTEMRWDSCLWIISRLVSIEFLVIPLTINVLQRLNIGDLWFREKITSECPVMDWFLCSPQGGRAIWLPLSSMSTTRGQERFQDY